MNILMIVGVALVGLGIFEELSKENKRSAAPASQPEKPPVSVVAAPPAKNDAPAT